MTPAWQKRRPQTSHADDWLITYADMITLLLCFFVVFLILSISKKDITQNQVHQSLAETAPVQPLPARAVEARQSSPEPAASAPSFLVHMPFPESHHDDEVADKSDEPPPEPVARVAEPAPVMGPPMPAKVASTSTPTADPVMGPPMPLEKVSLPEIVNNLKTQGNAQIEQKGDRITSMEMSSTAFFDRGSATLSVPGKVILEAVAASLLSDAYKDYQITVEGHTDDSPISTTQFPSNWELSTARASAVVHFFVEQGLPAQKLRAAGYADTMPKAPNRDANGDAIPDNQAQNRRVVIKLEKIEKESASATP